MGLRDNEARFAAKMLLAFVVLYGAWAALGSGAAHRLLLERAVVEPAVALVNAVSPGEAARAQGPALVSARARLSVREGCDGLDAVLLLAAAFLAAPLPWRRRLAGLALGVALVYGLNQARVVALWFALRNDRETFSLLHGFVAPAVLVAACCGFFAWWLWRRPAAA